MKPALIIQAAAAAALTLGLAVAPAQALGHRAPQLALERAFDSRAGALRAVHASGRTARARRSLARALGPQATLDVDPLTGTPRVLARLDGTLTPAAHGDRVRIALDYARAHAAALGLGAADFDTLRLVQATVSPDRVLHLRWRQAYRGIPLFDNDLRINVDGDGAVVNVLGSPAHDPGVASIEPSLSPRAALHRVMDAVSVQRASSVVSPPRGVRRHTRFTRGDSAELVLFGGAGGLRLAWRVLYAAGPLAEYAALVDARTGALLYGVDLTKLDLPAADVWENYPGAPSGGDTHTVTLAPYLDAGATALTGPNAHAWSDLNANGLADPDSAGGSPLTREEVRPHGPGNDFQYPFAPFTPQPFPLGAGDPPLCPPQFACAWDQATPGSWGLNRRQEAVQAFYLANRFHDHLGGGPIGFHEADGAFDAGDRSHPPDPLELRTDVGAASGPRGPAPEFLDNGSMTVYPDGQSPVMKLFLFSYSPSGPYRDIAGGDDAATVYHEYTHGLSGRLIHNADGTEALNDPQAGAISEAFSDWYAEDYLVAQGDVADTPAAGEVDVGRYSDYEPHTTRTQAADCPVVATPACPGEPAQTGHAGGYTYGDFGHVAGHPEVHADGEIFLETLWDIRSALGSGTAEGLITGAMRLSPPEPTFLDMRNAILAEDSTPAYGGANHAALWSIFAARGMGYYAASTGSDDIYPVQDFSPPPPAGGSKGTITGRVTSAATGTPLAGAAVGIGGHASKPGFEDYFRATSGADGTYRINLVPFGSYPELIASAPSYDPATVAVHVSAATPPTAFALRRDWASSGGGATVFESSSGFELACPPAQAMDQSLSRGWSGPRSNEPTLTIRLPNLINVTGFALDPGANCGDDVSATTRDYRIETSRDGAHFTCAAATVASAGCAATATPFTAAAVHRRNAVSAHAGTSGVGFVRITLLGPLSGSPGQSGHDQIDLTELSVYGVTPPSAPPAGRLVVSPNPARIAVAAAFDASSFTDPDSRIASYRWDFDGDGVTDATTAVPTTKHAYPRHGRFAARVVAVDDRGMSGAATTQVSVADTQAPKISVRLLGHARVRVTATCGLPCSLRASLTIARATAHRAAVPATLGARKTGVRKSGKVSVTLLVKARYARRLREAGIRRLRVTVHARAKDSLGRVSRPAFRRSLRL